MLYTIDLKVMVDHVENGILLCLLVRTGNGTADASFMLGRSCFDTGNRKEGVGMRSKYYSAREGM